jgi:ribonuclease P protein component
MSGGRAVAARLRNSGVRVSGGPWVLCADRTDGGSGQLIVALGRTAGPAVTRSRVRRLARDVFRAGLSPICGTLQFLLFVRKNVRDQPRRRIREDLEHLKARVPDALKRRDARAAEHAMVAEGGPLSH